MQGNHLGHLYRVGSHAGQLCGVNGQPHSAAALGSLAGKPWRVTGSPMGQLYEAAMKGRCRGLTGSKAGQLDEAAGWGTRGRGTSRRGQPYGG